MTDEATVRWLRTNVCYIMYSGTGTVYISDFRSFCLLSLFVVPFIKLTYSLSIMASMRRAAVLDGSRNSAMAPASHAGGAPAPRKGKWLSAQSIAGRRCLMRSAATSAGEDWSARRCPGRRCRRTVHARGNAAAETVSTTEVLCPNVCSSTS